MSSSPTDVQPSIFISYAHEDSPLAHALATAMEAEGTRVWLDQGELLIGDSLIEQISEAIAEFDFVAALVSTTSVESNWCRKEISLAMSKQLQRGARPVTVLPVRVGEVRMPPSLRDVKYVQLDPADVAACAAKVVADARKHLSKPASLPRGASTADRPARQWAAKAEQADESVRLVGVDSDGIGRPRSDGTRGSALYRIPLLLNRAPDPQWREAFPDAWNHPPAWTSMHRPGIASVQGDRIVLDGTTIEELEKHHLQTLKLVIERLNQGLARHLEHERARQGAEARANEAHEAQVQDVINRLDFDV